MATEKLDKKLYAARDRDELVAALFAAGHWATIGEARVAFVTFCEVLLDRLLSKNQPVDLFFVRLHCLPHHVAWKERCQRPRDQLSNAEKNKLLHNQCAGLREWLETGAALTLLSGGAILRNLEAFPTAEWFRVARQVETARLAKLQQLYPRYVLEDIRRSWPATQRLWRLWHTRSRASRARFFYGGPAGNRGFNPTGPLFLGRIGRPGTRARFVHRMYQASLAARRARRLKASGQRLPPVRTPKQKAADLRNGERLRRDTERRRAARMLLLPSVENPPQNLKLLALGNPGPGSLERTSP